MSGRQQTCSVLRTDTHASLQPFMEELSVLTRRHTAMLCVPTYKIGRLVYTWCTLGAFLLCFRACHCHYHSNVSCMQAPRLLHGAAL